MARELKIHKRETPLLSIRAAYQRATGYDYRTECGRHVPPERAKKRWPRDSADPRWCRACLWRRKGV